MCSNHLPGGRSSKLGIDYIQMDGVILTEGNKGTRITFFLEGRR